MSDSYYFVKGATYRVLLDPSVLPLARPAPVFKKGELVRVWDSQYAVKEGYKMIIFQMLERTPEEFLRIYVFDRDPLPEPDWEKYFEKV